MVQFSVLFFMLQAIVVRPAPIWMTNEHTTLINLLELDGLPAPTEEDDFVSFPVPLEYTFFEEGLGRFRRPTWNRDQLRWGHEIRVALEFVKPICEAINFYASDQICDIKATLTVHNICVGHALMEKSNVVEDVKEKLSNEYPALLKEYAAASNLQLETCIILFNTAKFFIETEVDTLCKRYVSSHATGSCAVTEEDEEQDELDEELDETILDAAATISQPVQEVDEDGEEIMSLETWILQAARTWWNYFYESLGSGAKKVHLIKEQLYYVSFSIPYTILCSFFKVDCPL